jgi:formylglycine-generating enzyme required for sulfatase activity
LSLSEGAYRLGPAAGPGGLEQIIRAAARFGTTRAALRDLLRAKALADNGGLAPSPLSLARSAADIAGFLSENPAAAAWLAETLPPESAVLLTASAWYQKQLASFAEITAVQSLAPPSSGKAPPARQLTVGGLSFTGIAGGTLVQDEPFPHPVPVDAFLIAGAEITREAFDNFLEANPRWRPEQRESLIEQGLAAAGYLRDDGFTAGGRTLDRAAPGSETGRTAVSWFAAAAYCEWLSARLPPALAGWVVRLPTEAEWEYAAKLVKSGRADMEIRGMEDGAWEWCADPYAPLAFLTATDEAIAAVGSPERSVRGGSWFNPAGAEARASLPPSSCSPFVSFRPVIARAPGQAAH